jgi:hypothetical protein
MGDFDRNDNSPKPNETKKLVVVLALGVVLIGLVAMQFMKRGAPQAAVGAPVGNGVALPPPILNEEISPQVLTNMLHEIENDPTDPLLRAVPAGAASLNIPPRNPFRMSAHWFQSLFAAAPVVPVTAPPVTPVKTPEPPVATPPVLPPTTTAAPAPVVLRAADYKLSGILNGTMAVLNGKVVKVGDVIGNARVIEISENAVRLQPADFPTGPTLVLSLASQLN